MCRSDVYLCHGNQRLFRPLLAEDHWLAVGSALEACRGVPAAFRSDTGAIDAGSYLGFDHVRACREARPGESGSRHREFSFQKCVSIDSGKSMYLIFRCRPTQDAVVGTRAERKQAQHEKTAPSDTVPNRERKYALPDLPVSAVSGV